MNGRARVLLLGDDARLAARVGASLDANATEVVRVAGLETVATLARRWPADAVIGAARHVAPHLDGLLDQLPADCLLVLVGAHGRAAPGADPRLLRVTRRHVDEGGLDRTLAPLLRERARATAAPTDIDLRGLLDALPALFDLRDADGRMLLVNPAFAHRLGVPAERLHGKPLDAVLDAASGRAERRRHAAALASGTPLPLEEHVLVRADGRRVTLLGSRAATAIGGARVVAGAWLDVSAGFSFEQRYRELVENSPQGEMVRRGMQPVYANQAFAEMLGYADPAQVIALGDVLRLVAPHDRDRLRGFAEARERGQPAPSIYEFDALRRDGTILSLQTLVRDVAWHDGGAVQHTVLDVTARRVAENALGSERNRARTYFEMAGVMVVSLDRKGRVTLVNRRGCETLGYREEQIVGRDWFEHFVPQSIRERLRLAFAESMAAGTMRAARFENDVLCADGSRRTIVWHNTVLRDERGRVAGSVSSGEDITDRLRAEAESRANRLRFQQLYDDNPSMFFTLADDATILSANRFGCSQLGHEVVDVVGRHASRVFVDEPDGEFERRVAECYARPDEVHRFECRMQRRNGDRLWVRVSARVSVEPGDRAVLLVVCEDITEAHRLSEQLSFQATHDALTGLCNRNEFEKRLARVIASARDTPSEHALCYLDLDQFKIINDTCGHSAGDELLRQLAGLLPQRVRRRDTLARLGGDEFGVLMEHCSLEQAKRVANGLRRTVADYRFVWDGKTFGLGVSIGVVPITGASERVAGVLAAADAACYAAKDRGRNRIHVYHADDADLAQRHGEMQWVARLGTALEHDRFELCFQPIAPITAGPEPGLHYELLLRLREDDGRQTPPGAFLPAAERYGLSPRTDRWVVDAAMDWLNGHPAHVEQLRLCSINLSGASLGDEGFLARLLGRLETGRVPCDRLCFEVTETAAIANLTAAIRFIGVLKELGCRFALDDFGSGVSSFAYLKSLPVDFLKIDGVFVKDILADPIDLAMVRSINELGHVMGKQTIAEFVESQEVLARLREIGVDYAQGYGIGRPRPIDELE